MSEDNIKSSISHVVINVRDIDEAHQFWTEKMGWEFCGRYYAEEGDYDGPGMSGAQDMRFYRRTESNHHDLALAQTSAPACHSAPRAPEMRPLSLGLNHVAIAYDDRDQWLAAGERLQIMDIPIVMRVDHGMTHSIYIADPDGNLFELLYNLPRETWAGDVDAALVHSVFPQPTEQGYLPDSTDYPTFGPPTRP